MAVMTRVGNAINRLTDASLYYARNGVAGCLSVGGTVAQAASAAGLSALVYMQVTNTHVRKLDNAAVQLLVTSLEEKGTSFGIVDPKLAVLAVSTALFAAGSLVKKVGNRMKVSAIADPDIQRLQSQMAVMQRYTTEVTAVSQAVGALNVSLTTLGNNLPELANRLENFTSQNGKKGVLVQLQTALVELTGQLTNLTGSLGKKTQEVI